MKTGALLVAAFLAAVGPTRAVDLRAKSTSSTRQFVVYCADTALRGRVTGFVEEVKHDVLDLLGERDRWQIPIVVSIEDARHSALNTPVNLRLNQTPQGPTIQLAVAVGTDPAAVHLQKHVIRAVLLDYIYRDHPPEGGETYVEAPWWLVSGAIEKFRQRDFGINSEVFQRLIEINKLPDMATFLDGHGQDIGGSAAAFDNACAHALLQLLIEQPEGKARLAQLLRHWPDANGDAVGALARAFPALGPDATSLQKWWTLNLARFGAADRYRGLSANDTEEELQKLLEFDVVADKGGKTRHFSIGEFKEFMKLRGARTASAARQKEIIALSTKANVLLRPVLSDYEQVFALLTKGRTRGVAERIHRAELYRTAVLQRKNDIGDYLNWYEATQMGSSSGAFDDYLRAARAADEQLPPSAHDAAISAYLDLLEDQL